MPEENNKSGNSSTPITDGVKMICDSVDKEIDSRLGSLFAKINKLRNDAKNMTRREVDKLKAEIIAEAMKAYASIQLKMSTMQTGLTNKLNQSKVMKDAMEKITQVPSKVEDVVGWAKSVGDFFQQLYNNTIGVVNDITGAIAYAAEEVNKIVTKAMTIPTDVEEAVKDIHGGKDDDSDESGE